MTAKTKRKVVKDKKCMSLSLRVPPFAEKEEDFWVMQVAGNWQKDGGAGEF